MALNAYERETIVRWSEDPTDPKTYIYTASRKVITTLSKNPAATLVDSGKHEGTAWAEFELSGNGDLITFRAGKRTRNLTDEQREALSARLKASRSANVVSVQGIGAEN